MELRDLGFLLSLSPLLGCVIDVEDGGDSGFGGNTTEPVQAADGPVCGNGVIEAGEACDADNFGAVTCESLALGTGQLSCSDTCEIVATACEEFMGTSGDDGGASSVSASGASASASATAADTAPDDDGYAESYGYDGYATSLGDGSADDGSGNYSPLCLEYAQAAAACYGGDVNEHAYFCEYNFDYYAAYGPACATALEEYYACLSTSPCGQFGVDCDAELATLEAACF